MLEREKRKECEEDGEARVQGSRAQSFILFSNLGWSVGPERISSLSVLLRPQLRSKYLFLFGRELSKKISPQAPLSNRPKHQTLQTPLGPRRRVALDPDLVLEGLDRAIYLRGQFGLGVALR